MVDSSDDASRVPVDLPQCQDEIASVIGRTLPVRTYRELAAFDVTFSGEIETHVLEKQ